MRIATKIGLALATLAFTAGTATAECNPTLTTASKPAKPLTVATLVPPSVPATGTVKVAR